LLLQTPDNQFLHGSILFTFRPCYILVKYFRGLNPPYRIASWLHFTVTSHKGWKSQVKTFPSNKIKVMLKNAYTETRLILQINFLKHITHQNSMSFLYTIFHKLYFTPFSWIYNYEIQLSKWHLTDSRKIMSLKKYGLWRHVPPRVLNHRYNLKISDWKWYEEIYKTLQQTDSAWTTYYT